jgi:hypothetical protein
MQPLARLARVAVYVFGFTLYVWFAAVHHAAEVRRRKRTRRL